MAVPLIWCLITGFPLSRLGARPYRPAGRTGKGIAKSPINGWAVRADTEPEDLRVRHPLAPPGYERARSSRQAELFHFPLDDRKSGYASDVATEAAPRGIERLLDLQELDLSIGRLHSRRDELESGDDVRAARARLEEGEERV